MYQRRLIECLKLNYRKKFRHRDDAPLALQRLREIKDFYQYDDLITAPLHGYKGVDDYYERASCRARLRDIQVPTMIVHAADDPFMTRAAIPTAGELSDCVTLELSRRGGHVGFVGGTPQKPRYWLEDRIPEYLRSCLTC